MRIIMAFRSPRMNRVRADLEGVGDEPPDVDSEMRDILDHIFGGDDVCQEGVSRSITLERIRKSLPVITSLLDAMGSGDCDSELKSPVSSSCSDSDENIAREGLGRREVAQATKVLDELVAAGYLEGHK